MDKIGSYTKRVDKNSSKRLIVQKGLVFHATSSVHFIPTNYPGGRGSRLQGRYKATTVFQQPFCRIWAKQSLHVQPSTISSMRWPRGVFMPARPPARPLEPSQECICATPGRPLAPPPLPRPPPLPPPRRPPNIQKYYVTLARTRGSALKSYFRRVPTANEYQDPGPAQTVETRRTGDT